MNLQQLLLADIGVIMAIPGSILAFNSLLSIGLACLFTAFLIYLENKTYQALKCHRIQTLPGVKMSGQQYL
ncbi:hypothetical protein [Candidatus Synchoanobacter obligatus]|uniref:Uncharacterized protein n=1 Tax=Candidatus Synchoanobacter obligatus TaxID=2919597 RepID=A0ABT1L3T4_9GAMM|nr:hypothetical protein [Candidatus Synchoanobacter obligatus]MCP8351851.1 hypothetical protein [Candidatus Synchoanobacter obligatus]